MGGSNWVGFEMVFLPSGREKRGCRYCRYKITILRDCLTAINNWMAHNFLQLNADKTEILIIGPESISNTIKLSLGSLSSNVSQTAKNLGVFFEGTGSHLETPPLRNTAT